MNDNEYCKICRAELGLEQLAKPIPKEYVRGVLACLREFRPCFTKQEALGFIMHLCKGRVNPVQVFDLLNECYEEQR